MIYKVEKKTYTDAPVRLNEVCRYAGAKICDENLKSLVQSCVAECEKEKAIRFAVCFAEIPVVINGDVADFSAFRLQSKNLVQALRGADTVLIFACTVGMGIDRLIKKYSEINPSRALIFQALGAERVETFIDLFIEDYKRARGVSLSPRYSAGYGDLPLTAQKDVFNFLNPQKHIGLTLNDSLLMSPSKSVTAFAGINGLCEKTEKACEKCNKTDCGYRR